MAYNDMDIPKVNWCEKERREYNMANVKKATRAAMGHLMRHYERSIDENGEYIKFGNQQIDPSRTHMNYNLAPAHNQLEFTHNRLKEVRVLKRKDVNVMCSWVVTAPKELPEEYHKEFFERTYKYLQQRYDPNGKNTISAYVHMDEVSPHMHFAFIPVVYDKKKKCEKVSAKEVINKTDLQTFHKDFQSEMDKFVSEHGYQFNCNVLNGATLEGNKSIEELKRGTAQQTLQNVHRATKKKREELNNLQKQKTVLEREINALKDMKNIQGQVLSSQQIKNIKTESILLDSEKVKISKNDLANLQKSALIGEQAEKIYDASKTYLKKAELMLKQAEQKNKEPMKEKMERLELKKKIETYDKALNQCPEEELKTFRRALKAVEEKNDKAIQKKLMEHNL